MSRYIEKLCIDNARKRACLDEIQEHRLTSLRLAIDSESSRSNIFDSIRRTFQSIPSGSHSLDLHDEKDEDMGEAGMGEDYESGLSHRDGVNGNIGGGDNIYDGGGDSGGSGGGCSDRSNHSDDGGCIL